VQQSALVAQVPVTGTQVPVPPGPVPPTGPPPGGGGGGGGGSASQRPLVQLEVQQSAPALHAPATATHAVLQVLVAGSQTFPQHCASDAQAAVSPRHCSGGAMQRGGLKFFLSHKSLLAVLPQQPRWGPELHVSPVGRQVELA
jgi:hypothetical protein